MENMKAINFKVNGKLKDKFKNRCVSDQVGMNIILEELMRLYVDGRIKAERPRVKMTISNNGGQSVES